MLIKVKWLTIHISIIWCTYPVQYEGLLHCLVVLFLPLDHLLVELLLLRRGEVPCHLVETETERLEDTEHLLSPLSSLNP